MKTIISMMLLGVATTLLSFSPYGGEGFEISLNGKVLIQRFGSDINKANSLQLDQSAASDKLTVKYYHCGKVGKHRTVTIKDALDKVVKTWVFTDSNEPTSSMSMYVKDILTLKKGNNILKLYYSSTELPNGRLLAAIVGGNNIVAKR